MSLFGTVRLAVVTGAAVALAAAASAATTVTIGQTDPASSVPCTPSTGLYALQTTATGTSYSVPAGQWSITSWSTFASGGQMGVMAFRPTTPGSYLVVGESQLQTLSGVGLKTIGLAPGSADPPLAVQGGDLLGFFSQGPTSGCGSGPPSTNISAAVTATEPAVGSVVTPNPAATATLLDISATLTAPATSSRTGYCAAAGDVNPFTGIPFQPGTFLDLVTGQPDTDPHYRGAIPANYFEGKGITCDLPVGYLATGDTVGYGGAGTQGLYPYYKKA